MDLNNWPDLTGLHPTNWEDIPVGATYVRVQHRKSAAGHFNARKNIVVTKKIAGMTYDSTWTCYLPEQDTMTTNTTTPATETPTEPTFTRHDWLNPNKYVHVYARVKYPNGAGTSPYKLLRQLGDRYIYVSPSTGQTREFRHDELESIIPAGQIPR